MRDWSDALEESSDLAEVEYRLPKDRWFNAWRDLVVELCLLSSCCFVLLIHDDAFSTMLGLDDAGFRSLFFVLVTSLLLIILTNYLLYE